MTETVTVRSETGGYDSNGDPIPPGAAVTLPALAVAPGNTAELFTTGGILDTAEFTVYLTLGYENAVSDDDLITVRGRECRARVQVWKRESRVGGVVVLCKSATGTSS